MTYDIRYFIAHFHKYDWLCHLATFIMILVQEGGQVIKPIILVKICYKLLYVIEGVGKVISWPQLTSKHLVTPIYIPVCNIVSDWPHTFLYLITTFWKYCITCSWLAHNNNCKLNIEV